MLIFVVGRTRLDRYEELRLHFEDWRDVRVVLDRREGERREPHDTFAGVERRRLERRHRLDEPVPSGTVLELVRSGAGDVLSIEFSGTAVVPRGSGVFEALLRDNPRVVRIDTVPEPSTLVFLGLDPPWRR